MGGRVEQGVKGRWWGAWSAAALWIGAVTVCAVALGAGYTPRVGIVAAALSALLSPGPIAAGLYAVACVGIGGIAARRLRAAGVLDDDAAGSVSLRAALGLSVMLTLSHAMGLAGLLRGDAGAGLAALGLGPLVVGAGLALRDLLVWARRTDGDARAPRDRLVMLAGAPVAAVLLLACLTPPGWLWSAEFYAFDSLSYHLELPKQWSAGRLWPDAHNVYSYLPGYFEAAFAHVMAVCAMSGGGFARATMDDGGVGAQVLHALVAVMAAGLAGRVAGLAAERSGCGSDARRVAQVAGWLAAITTPWSVVLGSMSYNEMAMIALSAAALLTAMARAGDANVRRDVIRVAVVAWLVGVACGVKPTALFFAGLPCAVALAVRVPRRAWAWSACAGVLVGIAALSPWLVRNASASGNPVFPYAAGLFGDGHWTGEQVARFASAHHFEGSVSDRLRLLVMSDPTDPAGDRHRGLMHPWFAGFGAAGTAALVVGLWVRRSRPTAALLGVMAAMQLAAWLAATHLQARFLTPMLVPVSGLIGLAAAVLSGPGGDGAAWRRRAVLGVIALGALARSGVLLTEFIKERGGAPAMGVGLGGGIFHGLDLREKVSRADSAARARLLEGVGPEAWVNLALGAGDTVYLLGDSTPYYLAGPAAGGARVLWHTTWDASPLGDAVRAHGNDPAAWTSVLRRRGVTHLLVNLAELERLSRSGVGTDGRVTSWYDPAVTAEVVRRWIATLGPPLAAWPNAGRAVFRVDAAGGTR